MSWSGRVIDPELLAEIDKLPDEVIAEATAPSCPASCWYAQVAVPRDYLWMSADFSTGGKTQKDVIGQCAKTIRDDLRGIGKFATHFDDSLLEDILLPHWRKRVGKA